MLRPLILAGALALAAPLSAIAGPLSVVAVDDVSNRCKQLMVTNHSDHTLEVAFSYIYVGRSNASEAPNSAEYRGDTVALVSPRQTSYVRLWSHHIACSLPYKLTHTYTWSDFTARQIEADRLAKERDQRYRDSTTDVVRRVLENEERVKEQNEAHRRQQEAAAQAREQERLTAEAERVRQQEAVARLQRQQQEYEAQARAERELHLRREQERMEQLRRQQEIERQAAERAAALRAQEQQRAALEAANRQMNANNCGYSASYVPIPPPAGDQNSSQWQEAKRRIDAQNAQNERRFHEDLARAASDCDARRRSEKSLALQHQQQQQSQQQLLQAQQEQLRRMQTEQKAQADLDAAIARGREAVREASKETRSMQDSNAELMRLLQKN